jgi:1-acyl-sn-glycerol-3-phosphate acyltransferase
MASVVAGVSRLVCGATAVWQCDPRAVRQRIYFANHTSHLDFIAIWSALPPALRAAVRPVAGSDYWAKGRLRPYLARRVFDAVLIDRPRPGTATAATASASIQRMAEEMGGRRSLIVFPEGTRTVDGQVGPFKSGLYHLARLRRDVELVPVYLENLNRILPKGEMLPVPMLSRVVFGPPFPVLEDEEKHEFLARARAAVLGLHGGQ